MIIGIADAMWDFQVLYASSVLKVFGLAPFISDNWPRCLIYKDVIFDLN